ncbi:MAG: metallopeptidase family protein [Actinomycetota bacterium]|nr:metallopeptidase family protein [Actinomycetota bacterium]
MNTETFEREVRSILDGLPKWVTDQLDNLVVVVEHNATHLQDPEGEGLFGIYEGIPLNERGVDYFGVTPDRIVVFYGPHLTLGLSGDALRDEIRTTVLHELGHHLGLSEERLHELGWG